MSEFRQRLPQGEAETLLLEKLLERCEALGFLKGKKKQRTDSTHVLAAVRALSLLELVGETMRRVLDEAARLAPEWLKEQMKDEWRKRYERQFDGYVLPTSPAKREELPVAVGEDGFYLLQAIYSEACPAELKTSPKPDLCRLCQQTLYLTPSHLLDDDRPLFLVVSRPGSGRKPWYLLTIEPVHIHQIRNAL